MAIKLGWSPLLDEQFGFGGGLVNSPLEAEGYRVEVGFMVKKNIFCVLYFYI
jgi:hypothetical protein